MALSEPMPRSGVNLANSQIFPFQDFSALASQVEKGQTFDKCNTQDSEYRSQAAPPNIYIYIRRPLPKQGGARQRRYACAMLVLQPQTLRQVRIAARAHGLPPNPWQLFIGSESDVRTGRASNPAPPPKPCARSG